MDNDGGISVEVNLLDLKKQYKLLEQDINQAIKQVLESTHFIMGENVRQLEQRIAEYTGVKHAIAVANGTDALMICLKALDIKSGDEVITTPYTFFASAETASILGATPIFVDIDPETLEMDATKLERAITKRTKAIIPVHIFGQMCDMNPIMEIADRYGLPVIEDACQAIGAEYNGRKAGSIGLMGTYSFFPSKNLGCYGDGGMITTNSDEMAEKIRMLRAHGARVKYHHEIIGYNSRLDELQAAILNVKLPYLDKWLEQRMEHGYYYTENLKGLPIVPQAENKNCKSTYHQYCIQVKEVEHRDKLIEYLNKNGISTAIYYPIPAHLLEAYKDHPQKEGSCPVAEEVCKRTLALPIYPELSRQEQDYIITKIKNFFIDNKVN